MKQLETTKTLGESREKQQKARVAKLEKELETERTEKQRWESKVSELNSDLSVSVTTPERRSQNRKLKITRWYIAQIERSSAPNNNYVKIGIAIGN